MSFISPNAFTFHNEESLRQRFATDLCSDNISKSSIDFRALKFINVDECLTRCLTQPADYIVALQSNMINVVECR